MTIALGVAGTPRFAGLGSIKVLPLRMEAAVVDKLDEAWKRQGLHSRTDLFRKSLRAFLASAGEADVAAMLATGS